MLTITYIGTDHRNPGDTIADLGARAVVTRALGAHHTISVMLRAEVDTASYVLPPSDVTVVSCTPWIWHRAETSHKTAALREILAQDRSRLRIAIGAGACYLAGQQPVPGDIEGVRSTFGRFDAFYSRDPLAHEVAVAALGARARLRPCPSIYAAAALGITAAPSRDLAIVAIDPYHCFDADFLASAARTAIVDAQLTAIRASADVICMTDVDERFYRARFGAPTVATRAPREILRALAQYRRIVAGRVHAAVPALAFGARVTLLPIDSRCLTATVLGADLADVGVPCAWGRDGKLVDRRIPLLSIDAFADEVRELASAAGVALGHGLVEVAP